MEPKAIYQLWCYYEREDVWKMESLHKNRQDAEDTLEKLREHVDTPSMADWAIIKVEGWW